MKREPRDWRGARIGALTILEPADRDESRQRAWLAKCDCGRVAPVRISDKIRQTYASCGQCGTALRQARREKAGRHAKDWTGIRIGHLTFLGRGRRTEVGQQLWSARCDCGHTSDVNPWNKVRQTNASCGHCGIARAESAQARERHRHGNTWLPAPHHDEWDVRDLWRMALCKIWRQERSNVQNTPLDIAARA